MYAGGRRRRGKEAILLGSAMVFVFRIGSECGRVLDSAKRMVELLRERSTRRKPT